MGIGVQRNADVAVADDVLQRFGIHPVLIKKKESGMSANDGLDLWLCTRFQDLAEASPNFRRHGHHQKRFAEPLCGSAKQQRCFAIYSLQ